jgi:rfaE bifunctional protein kinase chain/domain
VQSRLNDILDRFASRTIGVIGDLIADEFLYGQISRISREAPVLVLNYREIVRLPGGAANAASNLAALGCKARIIGAVGNDAAGAALVRSLKRRGADTRFLLSQNSLTTPVKTRILAGAHHSAPQQVIRIDRSAKIRTRRLDRPGFTRRALSSCDGIILSDYGFGTVSSAVLEASRAIAIARKIPLVVDSRFEMKRFRAVTSITPNITELESATGLTLGDDEDLLHKVGRRVLRQQKLQSLLVTQGRFGMTLFERRRPPLHIPIFGTDEVADVTGAGDTVIAVFTLALACGATPEEAARLANYAGGIVVMKRGTSTVTRREIRRAIDEDAGRRHALQ